MEGSIPPSPGDIAKEALQIAKNCRHYAMCKIDFLGSGVCASGLEKQYVSYFPQGRMDLYAALREKLIPVTEQCAAIADDCNLCGKCDYQCYFVTEMRPSKVMKALKDYIEDYLANGGEIVPVPEDPILAELRRIVGPFWAANDPAIGIAYHHDLCPHVDFKMPQYVVMPNSQEELAAIIRLLNQHQIAYVVRGNGASAHGLVFSDGAVLDLQRMKTIDFDEKNWLVTAGPGVAAFDLQSAAAQRGFRVHTAEPAALVCANIMTSGILSTFSTTYGISADNFIDAQFVARDGSLFSLNDISSPNLFSYQNLISEHEALAICVSVSMKLHPVTSDERGILVPCQSLADALDFAKECSVRHIGLAIGILGEDFISTFIASTKRRAAEARDIFARRLGMPYLVLLIGDKYALRSVDEMGYPVIDQELFKTLYQGLPSLSSARWLDLLDELSGDEPFSYLKLGQFNDLAEIALAPSPAQMTNDIDPDLRPFFARLFQRPEMSDLVWLNTFRIQSARYNREKPTVGLVFYLPIDTALITEIQQGLGDIAEKNGLRGGFGFITPFDNGKRCVWEYDYYFDHNDPDDLVRIQRAAHEAGALLDEYTAQTGTVRQVRYVVNRGCCRKENLLYT